MNVVPLREFSRDHAPAQDDKPARTAAALLTGGLYVGLALLLAWWPLRQVPLPVATREITAILLPDPPKPRVIPPPPVHLAKSHAAKPAPPHVIVALGAPPQAPAPLPASAAEISSMLGGSSGNGPMGQAASGNGAGGSGSGGNGTGTGGCLDAAWMRAVSERVRQFFHYPPEALAVRKTGVVMVHFVVRRDGQIERLQIGKSSGDAGLDKAGMDILQKTQTLPPIPDRMRADRVEGDLPINFGVRSFSGSGTTGTC